MKFLEILFIFLPLALSGCGGPSAVSPQSDPVALPTPFSGSMTAGTSFFVENGFLLSSQGSRAAQMLFASEAASPNLPGESCFPFFNPVGVSLGTICFSQPANTFQDMGNVITATSTFTLSLNDGVSTLTSENFRFILFDVAPEETGPLPDTPPGTTPNIQSGVGWGISSQGTGVFADANNCVVNYRTLSEFQMFSDGSFFPFLNDHCECFITCDQSMMKGALP